MEDLKDIVKRINAELELERLKKLEAYYSREQSQTDIKCGHIITDGGSITFTSTDAANGLIEILTTLVESMAKDISNITGISIEDVVNDYKEENELDLMTAAFNAVLRRKGCKIEQTPTRYVINRLIRNQNSKTT